MPGGGSLGATAFTEMFAAHKVETPTLLAASPLLPSDGLTHVCGTAAADRRHSFKLLVPQRGLSRRCAPRPFGAPCGRSKWLRHFVEPACRPSGVRITATNFRARQSLSVHFETMVPQRGFEYLLQPIVNTIFYAVTAEAYPQKAPRLKQRELNRRWLALTPCSTVRCVSTLTLRVPDELDQALERQSAALCISKSDLALEALRRYLRVAEFRTIRTKLLARAQADSIDTDEDVFEALKQ